ncbi:hypothetical protein NDU88_001952 [Pleurodeles waltl]|uniref:Uncharacterized protein n=1 Tax=Pleurodeles waltl TaxID=8319 RepID=A0AAV7KRG3_PLEWA|nr:hypothetical protein NDU88_001952 [Pleurodeles waltl]
MRRVAQLWNCGVEVSQTCDLLRLQEEYLDKNTRRSLHVDLQPARTIGLYIIYYNIVHFTQVMSSKMGDDLLYIPVSRFHLDEEPCDWHKF